MATWLPCSPTLRRRGWIPSSTRAGITIPPRSRRKWRNTITRKTAALYFAAGFHPSNLADFRAGDYERLAALLASPKGVAVGEIGLDYHYDDTDETAQKRAFCAQLELADSLGLPFIVHSRDAAADTLQILKDNRAKLSHGGVMHCFSGSPETAKEYLKLGLYISFAGPVTFKNARRLDEVAKIVPADRILAETDSPYLAPEPLRGTNAHTLFKKLNAKG